MRLNSPKSVEEVVLDTYPKQKLEEDLYDFLPQAERIKEYLEKSNSPNTIGIYGSWGSGKSTLKNFIIKSIEPLL